MNKIVSIGEVFQIEVSDGPIHSLGSCQKVNFYYLARVFMGAHEVFTIQSLQCVYRIAYMKTTGQ